MVQQSNHQVIKDSYVLTKNKYQTLKNRGMVKPLFMNTQSSRVITSQCDVTTFGKVSNDLPVNIMLVHV